MAALPRQIPAVPLFQIDPLPDFGLNGIENLRVKFELIREHLGFVIPNTTKPRWVGPPIDYELMVPDVCKSPFTTVMINCGDTRFGIWQIVRTY